MLKRSYATAARDTFLGDHTAASVGVPEFCGDRPSQPQAIELRCSHCGLNIKIEQNLGGPILVYDRDEWKRRCLSPYLGSPAYCIE